MRNSQSDENKTEKGSESESGSENSSNNITQEKSVSVVASNLTADGETQLRKYVTKRVAKGNLHPGIGSITNLDIGPDESTVTSCCYYCMLQKDVTSSDDSDVLEWMVCYMTMGQHSLDQFQTELDQYSHGLVRHLDEKMTELTSRVGPYLDAWYDVSIQFMSYPVQWLSNDLKFLLSAALSSSPIRYGCSEKEKDIITRFIKTCSIAEELTKSPRGGNEITDDPLADTVLVDIADVKHSKPDTTLHIDANFKLTNKQDCTPFCEEWASTLLSGDTADAHYVRQVCDTYRLKAVQDINSLQRLVHKAESDHYALYRALVFLQRSDNASMLLERARHETTTKETLAVLDSLREYIQNNGGFKLVT